MEDQEEPKNTDLGKLEQQGSSKTPISSNENPANTNDSGSNSSSVGLKDREENATKGTESTQENGEKTGLYKSVQQKFKGRGSSSAKKWIFGLFAGGGAGLLVIIIAIFLLLNSTKLIQLAAHIEASRLARISSDYTSSSDEILDQTLAVDTASDPEFEALSTQFSDVNAGDGWGSMWSKINEFRPDKVLQKLQTDGDLEFTYTSKNILGTKFTRNVLTGVNINGEDFPYDSPSFFDKVFSPIQSYKDAVSFSKDLNTALSTAMDGRSVIIRGAVANQIREKLGISLSWWNPAKYRGKSEQAARVQEEGDSVGDIDNGISPAASTVPAIEDAANTANQDIEACATNPSCLTPVVADGGALPSNIIDTIANAISDSVAQDVVKVINPLYAAATVACLIYDGSYQSSGTQTQIDNSSDQLQRTGYAVETASDQEKAGDTNGEAVGAMNWKTGDTSSSVPELMSAGISVNTANTSISPETPTDGSYDNVNSIFNALPSEYAGFAGEVVNKACKLLTNFGVAIGLGVVNIIISVASDFTAPEAEDSIAQTFVTKITDIATNVFTKKELTKLGLYTIGTAGASIGLKYYVETLVAQKSSIDNAGLATGAEFDNAADAGIDLNEQELEQHYYARPLTYAETATANETAQQYSAQLAQNQSLYQRYFAISNVNSLVSRIVTLAETHLNRSAFSGLMSLPEKLFNGSIFSDIFSNLTPKAFASSDPIDTTDYGIVQWGWSQAEETLKAEPAYAPLENQQALENAAPIGGETAVQYISQTYGWCWTDSMGQLLTSSNPSGQPAIARMANGDVIPDEGRCSPDSLGSNNTNGGPLGTPLGDLVFRYRLEMNYEETMDQLLSIQNPTSS